MPSTSYLLFVSVLSLLSSDSAFPSYSLRQGPHCGMSQILVYVRSLSSYVLPASPLSKTINNSVLYIRMCMCVCVCVCVCMSKVPERIKIYISNAEIF